MALVMSVYVGWTAQPFFSNPNKYVNLSVFTALLKVSTWKEENKYTNVLANFIQYFSA